MKAFDRPGGRSYNAAHTARRAPLPRSRKGPGWGADQGAL